LNPVVVGERFSDDLLQVPHPAGRSPSFELVRPRPASLHGLAPQEIHGASEARRQELGCQVQRVAHGSILPPFLPIRVLIRLHQVDAGAGD
jgi:hypothetical protein